MFTSGNSLAGQSGSMQSWLFVYGPKELVVQVVRFHPAAASGAELAEYAELQRSAAAFDQPAEPPPTREWALARLTRPPSPDRRRLYWTARLGSGELTGTGDLVLLGDKDTDLAGVGITVSPGFRGRGLGTALLREVAAAAGTRRTLFAEAIRTGTSGQAFADKHEFAVVQQTVQLSLDLAAADRGRWQVPAASGYRLAQWTGRAPDQLLVSYAAARNAIREAPHGEMSFTEPEWTALRVRDEEADARARRYELRVAAAVHEASGQVAGLTYLEVHEHRPEVAVQQDTAVLEEHRGHGLGSWLKAANLLRLTADHPAVMHVRTSNAADNEHMLRVNGELGFTRDYTTQNREAGLAALRVRLAAAAAS